MFPAPFRLSLPCLIVAVLFWSAISSSFAFAASQPVTEGWEYRWGDSPINADTGSVVSHWFPLKPA